MSWTKESASTTWTKKEASPTSWDESKAKINFSADSINFSMDLIGWNGRALWQEST